SNLYVGGDFTQANDGASPVAATNVARWDGSAWSALGSGGGNGVDGTVEALAVSGNDLYVGGYVAQANARGASPVAANRVARWDGAAWSALGSGVDNTLFALGATAAGELYAGGQFAMAGGKASARLGRYFVPALVASDAAAVLPASGTVPLTFTIAI